MKWLLVAFCVVFLTGCQTTKSDTKTSVNTGEKEMLKSVASALVGEEITDEEMNALIKDVKNDKEAQSAIESISNSLDPKNIQRKYCPVDGARYAPHFIECPEHNVKLEILE